MPLSKELLRSILMASVVLLLLLAATWMFVRYHTAQQTELAGFATARAVAEQVALQRQIYAQEIVPRALLAGMRVDVNFQAHENTLPVPVALVNLTGKALTKEFPGSKVLLYSRLPFTFRGMPELDDFEREALTAIEAAPEKPFYRVEEFGEKKFVRYAVADVMAEGCVSCHNHHPQSPRTDWKVGDIRGAIEVTLPITELAQRIQSKQVGAGIFLLGGSLLFSAALFLIARHDMRRIRREQAALTDAMTGLYTRSGAVPLIENEIARARRLAYPVSFVLFDVDHFKRVNDTHGHAVGDQVLMGVGRLLSREIRQFDIAARWGGEEFLAVLPHVGLEGARLMAERLRARVQSDTAIVSVTISGGIAELAPDDTVDSVVAKSDIKLYEAKQAGRNLVR